MRKWQHFYPDMKRTPLTLPDNLLYTHQLRVRITDINYGNHTGNHHLTGFLHDARAVWLKHHQLTELDIGGCGMILAALEINFLAETFFADDLTIQLLNDPASIGSSRFELYYRILKTNDNTRVAEARCLMVSFDYDLRKPVPLPEKFLQILRTSQS